MFICGRIFKTSFMWETIGIITVIIALVAITLSGVKSDKKRGDKEADEFDNHHSDYP